VKWEEGEWHFFYKQADTFRHEIRVIGKKNINGNCEPRETHHLSSNAT